MYSPPPRWKLETNQKIKEFQPAMLAVIWCVLAASLTNIPISSE